MRSARITIALGVLLAALLVPLPAAEHAWKTGKQFRQQLDLETGVTWAENPLRQGLGSLSRNQGVAIFLDRRIDPDQRIDLAQAGVTLESLLKQIGSHVRASVCLVDSVVYIGPEATAEKLATIAALRHDDIQKLPAGTKRRLAGSARWRWEELTTPRDLIQQLAGQAGVKVAGLERVPHDLWAAGDWPELSFAERLTLVLAGFDLTFELADSGAIVRLVPMPDSPRIERSYSPKGNASQLVSRITQSFPKAAVRATGGQVQVFARVEEHEAISRLLSGQPEKREQPVKGQQVYTLKIENQPVGQITQGLAQRLNLTVKFDPAVTGKLNDLVSFEVKNVTREQLFEKLLAPAGLSFQIRGSTIEVGPQK